MLVINIIVIYRDGTVVDAWVEMTLFLESRLLGMRERKSSSSVTISNDG